MGEVEWLRGQEKDGTEEEGIFGMDKDDGNQRYFNFKGEVNPF